MGFDNSAAGGLYFADLNEGIFNNSSLEKQQYLPNVNQG